MAISTLKPFKDCVRCVLIQSKPSDQEQIPNIILDIAPTMQNITHDGKKYFRMKGSRHVNDDGSQGALYLWYGMYAESFK